MISMRQDDKLNRASSSSPWRTASSWAKRPTRENCFCSAPDEGTLDKQQVATTGHNGVRGKGLVTFRAGDPRFRSLL